MVSKQIQPGPAARGMTLSTFYAALAEVFPHGLGSSLVADQVLTEFSATAQEALDAGADPLQVWQALLRASGRATEENLFWHRREIKPRAF